MALSKPCHNTIICNKLDKNLHSEQSLSFLCLFYLVAKSSYQTSTLTINSKATNQCQTHSFTLRVEDSIKPAKINHIPGSTRSPWNPQASAVHVFSVWTAENASLACQLETPCFQRAPLDIQPLDDSHNSKFLMCGTSTRIWDNTVFKLSILFQKRAPVISQSHIYLLSDKRSIVYRLSCRHSCFQFWRCLLLSHSLFPEPVETHFSIIHAY